MVHRRPASLPASDAPLIGRVAELADIQARIERDGARLVTLRGTGGAGKSRLALAAAAALASRFRVVVVDLAPVQQGQMVLSAIADMLDVQESGARALEPIVCEVLEERPTLLVLDNFEQVLSAAPLVVDVLARCPSLVVLVTTREALKVRPEYVVDVPPLPVPDLHQPLDVRLAASVPSIVLFEERARARRASFRLTAQNLSAVAGICVHLDGLPLAIELAAAQMEVFEPSSILARLRAREPFVLPGPRDLPPRHQSLQSTIDWSYDLLDERQQAVFRSCGVFAGGFDPLAVAALVDAGPGGLTNESAILQQLAALATRSLVRVVDPGPTAVRFGLLQTLRAYALEQLEHERELDPARERHARYYVSLAERLHKGLRAPSMATTLDHLALEYPNFREVFRWSAETNRLEVGLRLAGVLYRFWLARGHLSEARQWLEPALARVERPDPYVHAVALNAAGVLAGMQHDHARAIQYFQHSVELWTDLDQHAGLANAHLNLGLVAHNTGDLARAEAQFVRARELYADIGDRSGLGRAVGSLARLAREAGELERAHALFEQAVDLLRAAGDEWAVANSYANLGYLALERGDLQVGREYFRQALEVRRALGNVLGVAECLEGFSALAAGQQPRLALLLLGAADALREQSGAPVPSAEQPRYATVLEQASRGRSAAEVATVLAEGRALSLEAAVELTAREDLLTPARPADASVPPAVDAAGAGGESLPRLTRREREIAGLVALGRSNRDISEELVVGLRTVETHLEHIFAKLQVRSRAEVAVWAAQHGLLPH